MARLVSEWSVRPLAGLDERCRIVDAAGRIFDVIGIDPYSDDRRVVVRTESS